MTIGTFTLIKNEASWVYAHVMRTLSHVDYMCFYDGNSTDGTLQLLKGIKDTHPDGHRLFVFEGKDPADLRDDYVRLFDECMRQLPTEWAFFLHPDMDIENPEQIREAAKTGGIAQYVNMSSYAGEPGGQLYRIEAGRSDKWKSIYRLRNPDLGAHYFGHYGAQNEDVYFRDITGDSHEHHGDIFNRYPYPVTDSGIRVKHFSDVRSLDRRLGRMKSCLRNQGYAESDIEALAAIHPRVTLKDGLGFKFTPSEYPDGYLALQAQGLKLAAKEPARV